MNEDDIERERLRAPARFALSRVVGRPIYLRRTLRDGWRRPLATYVRWCDDCDAFSVTHAAGYGRVHCRLCGDRMRVLTWARVRDKPVGIAIAYAAGALLLALLWLYLHR